VLLAKIDKNICIAVPSDLKRYKIGGIRNLTSPIFRHTC
jgi:hypothetical protein